MTTWVGPPIPGITQAQGAAAAFAVAGLLGHTSLPNAGVHQLLTLDRRLLDARIGAVPATSLRALETGLRLVLSL